MIRRPPAALLAPLVLLTAGATVHAKPPTLTGLFPAGAERGRTVATTASGTFDHWPPRCWVDGPGLSVKASEKKGELAFEVAADARPGVYWVRLYDEEGATGLRPFLVGGLPELMETEPNDDPQHPQTIEKTAAGVVVNGRLEKPGDVDGFAVALEPGQVLTADLEADRHIKSPMDGVLQIVSADGFVLAQNDDSVDRDPRILFRAPAKGAYIARVFAFPSTPDSSIHFAGGPAYVYRLTLTTGGFIEHAFPLGVSREAPTPVAAVGPNITKAESVLDVPGDDPRDLVPLFNPALAGGALVRRVSGSVAVEAEPNDSSRPQPLADRASVSGRIDPPGDRDAYRITLKKGERRRFRLESRGFGLPLDGVLLLLDAGGKRLAENDDPPGSKTPDPELVYTPPADGDFIIEVRDLYHGGGPNHAYLLSVVAPEPDFDATLAADAFTVKPGEKTRVVVTVDRRNDYGEPIEIAAEALPQGVTATTALSNPSGDSAKSATIEITAAADARSGPFRIVARSGGPKGPPRPVLAAVADFKARTNHPWLTVLPPAQPAK